MKPINLSLIYMHNLASQRVTVTNEYIGFFPKKKRKETDRKKERQ